MRSTESVLATVMGDGARIDSNGCGECRPYTLHTRSNAVVNTRHDKPPIGEQNDSRRLGERAWEAHRVPATDKPRVEERVACGQQADYKSVPAPQRTDVMGSV